MLRVVTLWQLWQLTSQFPNSLSSLLRTLSFFTCCAALNKQRQKLKFFRKKQKNRRKGTAGVWRNLPLKLSTECPKYPTTLLLVALNFFNHDQILNTYSTTMHRTLQKSILCSWRTFSNSFHMGSGQKPSYILGNFCISGRTLMLSWCNTCDFDPCHSWLVKGKH